VLHQREVPGIGVSRRLDRDRFDRDHVAPEDHRLQVQAPAVGKDARRPGEHVAVDLVLAPGAVVLGRAEVLEGAEAGDSIDAAERVTADLADIHQVDVEAVAAARLHLR